VLESSEAQTMEVFTSPPARDGRAGSSASMFRWTLCTAAAPLP
jgi:hypothetical protein